MEIGDHYKANRKRLVKMASSMIRDNCPTLAEDAVQQTYLKLLQFANATGELEEEYGGLIFRILFNVCHDINNEESKRGMTGRKEEIEGWTDTVDRLEAKADPSLFRKMVMQTVLGRYTNSSLRKASIMELYFVYGYNHQEVAHALKIKPKTSRNVVATELAKLNRRMRDE